MVAPGFAGTLVPEIKSFGEDGSFDGILSTYGNLDLVGDICEKGCFDKTLQTGGLKRTLLRDHDWTKVIGYFDVVDSTDALRIKGHICTDTQLGKETFALMKFGAIDGLSIGYYANDYSYDRNGVRHLTEVDLREGSVVGDPANPEARIQAKSRRMERMSKFAGLKFLTKMTEEERTAALAELDALGDKVAEDEPDATVEQTTGTPDDKPSEDEAEKEKTTPEDDSSTRGDDDPIMKAIQELSDRIDAALKPKEA